LRLALCGGEARAGLTSKHSATRPREHRLDPALANLELVGRKGESEDRVVLLFQYM